MQVVEETSDRRSSAAESKSKRQRAQEERRAMLRLRQEARLRAAGTHQTESETEVSADPSSSGTGHAAAPAPAVVGPRGMESVAPTNSLSEPTQSAPHMFAQAEYPGPHCPWQPMTTVEHAHSMHPPSWHQYPPPPHVLMPPPPPSTTTSAAACAPLSSCLAPQASSEHGPPSVDTLHMGISSEDASAEAMRALGLPTSFSDAYVERLERDEAREAAEHEYVQAREAYEARVRACWERFGPNSQGGSQL